MGKKRGKSRKGSKAERDSEEEESTTSQMSGTSSEKRRLAETREELQEANLEALRLAAGAAVASKRSTWNPGSLHPISSDAPPLAEPKDILLVRKYTLDWLGFYSFVLRLGKEERKMLTPGASQP
jgi:hypothetical protein